MFTFLFFISSILQIEGGKILSLNAKIKLYFQKKDFVKYLSNGLGDMTLHLFILCQIFFQKQQVFQNL